MITTTTNEVVLHRAHTATSVIDEATELLERRAFDAAVKLLQGELERAPSAQLEGLLGTAYFLAESYQLAVTHLTSALATEPDRAEWRAKLTLASENLAARVAVEFPPVEAFQASELLAAPRLDPEAIPAAPNANATSSPWRGLLDIVARVSGSLATDALHAAAQVADTLDRSNEVWTNWYRKPLVVGIALLGATRDRLNRHNLVDPYPEGELTAFQSHGLVPPPGVEHFRTPDGSWNNLSNPKEGAAGVRFPRNVALSAAWSESRQQLLTPNPAEISHVLLSRGSEGMKEVPFLNMIAACWIQFMVHDWVSHRTSYDGGVHEIPLPADHPARRLFHQTKLIVPKTMADPTRSTKDRGLPLTTINEVTSWWDGSQIYGSDFKSAASLRAFQDGKLTLDARGHLPIGEGGIERTGYSRNWWLGLAMLHTLFVREHNAICDMLKRRYPAWEDNRLYNVARLINAAIMAKIHTVEWTPAILPNHGLYLAMNANWYGFAEMALHPRDRKVLRTFKIRSPEVGGLVGNSTDKHGRPYGLSEEFTEVYRLHELLPDELILRSRRDGTQLEVLPLAGTRQVAAHEITDRISFEDLFYSFGNQHPGQLVLNNFPRTLQQLSIPGNPVYDMGAVDILRARERGVPRYNEFRRQFGLKPIRRFEDLTTDPAQLAALKRVYNDHVELIDMHVGSRAESQRPTGFGFGETLFQVFILNASRRLQADRFFTESYNAATYTPEGLQWIDDTDMKHLLLRHFPELAATGLSNVKNAFEPWDTGELAPERHPLRAFS
ncbi:MAG TPA: peroxidase family protein [Polyangiaceae bacterium]|nr:peroxidase family protein [Polyangiaceae bacterium]